MRHLTRDQEIAQDRATRRFREILDASGFARPALGALDGPILDEKLDLAAQRIARIDQGGDGELFARLGEAPFEASDIFYSNPLFATALMRAGFSPMVFEPTWQGACFKRLRTGASYEQSALEIYTRAFDLGWDPESKLDLSGLGDPALKAFTHWIDWSGRGDALAERGRQIFELCSRHCPKFTLARARKAIVDCELDEDARAHQALSYFSSLIDQRALSKAAKPAKRQNGRSPSL